MNRRCDRCANWKAVREESFYDVAYRGRGECRANPPKADRNRYMDYSARWPLTRCFDWCAAFVAREEAADGERHA